MIDKSKVNRDEYSTTYRVHCSVCDKRYVVEEQTSYHYPTYTWRKAR